MPDFHEKNKGTLRSSAEGADTIAFLASTPRSLETGKFWFDRHPVRTNMPFGFTESSEEEKKALWKSCQAYVGLEAEM